jgi:hypothetical protein|tara:strand:- start:118 stop:558 length:441 start_codon:yes stop_codon:yes gene_type:complete
MAYSGKFRPRNPKKYKGDSSKIVYRSSWEARCMNYFDLNDNILWWASEEVIVPYRDPVTNKARRYFPDFIIKIKQRTGSIETIMIEVKPQSQKDPPKTQARNTKKYIKEVYTYTVNQMKWRAASEYCLDRKWKFMVLTEKDLGIKS